MDKTANTVSGIIAVNASAGSGKTHALAKRFVSLFLAQPKTALSFKNILAITFTRKASKEMKQRIIQFFKEISFNTDKGKEVILPAELSSALQQKARKLVDEMLANYDFFQVQTIDSFMNALLKSCAFRLDRSASYETKTDHKEYLIKSLDLEIEKALKDEKFKTVFDEFLHRLIFVENRISWFPKEDILKVMEQLVDQTSAFGKEFIPADASSSKDIVDLKKRALKILEELYGHLPEKTNSTFKKKLGTLFGRAVENFVFDDLSESLTREEFPINKGGEVPKKTLKLWDEAREMLQKIALKEAYSYFNYYIEIFKNVYNTFQEIAKKDDILFLSEFNKQAETLFESGSNIIPEVYYRLASRYLHFLIDEFQDTSVLQWQNLKPLIKESLASGGSFFYVGDKKQAIYSFRGGNAGLFDQVPDHLYQYESKETKLEENYRSQKAIVEFNNEIFSAENLKSFLLNEKIELEEPYRKDILKIFSNISQKWQEEKGQGFVSAEKIESENAEEEDLIKDKLLKLIADLRQRAYGFRDIAVLFRDNAQVELITSWLIENDIPAESEKTLNIRENSLIKELISFIMFLNSPIDNAAFVSFVTGDIFLNVSKIPEDEMRDFIFSHNPRKTGRKENLYKLFRDSYPDIWDKLIEPFFITVGVLPFYEFIINIFSTYNILEKFSECHLFFISFLELVKEKSKENSGIAYFLDYFLKAEAKELFVHSAKADAVKVLTIHGAKGLQFPVVINPFFEIVIQNSGTFYIPAEKGIFMIPLKEARDKFAEKLMEFESRDTKENCINELNTAYVALTRAEEELYIWYTRKTSNRTNLAAFLFSKDKIETGTKNIFIHKDETLNEVRISPQNYQGLSEFLKDEREDILKITKRKEVTYGNALHYAFSFIGNLSGKSFEKEIETIAIKTALKFGKIFEDKVKRKMNSLIASNEIRKFFFIENGTVYPVRDSGDKVKKGSNFVQESKNNTSFQSKESISISNGVYQEKEIVDKAGQTKIIDRLIVSDKEIMVVDYKSTEENKDAHIEQVKEYCSIVSEIYPGKQVKGFIIYFDSEIAIKVV
ncbi:MAG: UvrD-helicase domain-containing protein [Elusimicrobia bacterium]|nr:UvrD-helicase domain-containing protein [Elusimicrobiota bacterium]